MNDPHIVALTYRIVETDSFQFKSAPAIDFETTDFVGHLSDNVLRLEPKEHFNSVEEVRPIAELFIQYWEIDAGLTYNEPHFKFQFAGSEIIDRMPKSGVVKVHSAQHAHFADHVSVTRQITVYPNPPEIFNLTPEVELFWKRYSQFLEVKEQLQAMAYACITFLERVGSRKSAARHFGIEYELLNELGNLSANKGTELNARKLRSQLIPLTKLEEAWVKSAIKEIIWHLATRKEGKMLKMSDLPSLIE